MRQATRILSQEAGFWGGPDPVFDCKVGFSGFHNSFLGGQFDGIWARYFRFSPGCRSGVNYALFFPFLEPCTQNFLGGFLWARISIFDPYFGLELAWEELEMSFCEAPFENLGQSNSDLVHVAVLAHI